MRCKACDSEHCKPYSHGDWYCSTCASNIRHYSSKTFDFRDVQRILYGEDYLTPKEFEWSKDYKRYPNLWKPND